MPKPINTKDIEFEVFYYTRLGDEIIFHKLQNEAVGFICLNKTRKLTDLVRDKKIGEFAEEQKITLFKTLSEAEEFEKNEIFERTAKAFWRSSNIESEPDPKQIISYFRMRTTCDSPNLGYHIAGKFFDNSEDSHKCREATIEAFSDARKASYLLKNEIGSILRNGIDSILSQLRMTTLSKEFSTKEFLLYSLRSFYKDLVSDRNVTFAKDLKISPKEKEEYKQSYIKEKKAEFQSLLETIDYIDRFYDFQNHTFLAGKI